MRTSRNRILRAIEKELPISQEEQEERDALVDGEEESDQEVEAKNQKYGESIWIRGQNGVDWEMKRRVTIKDLCNLDEGERVIVRCNKSYVPNTKAAYLISSFLYDLGTNDTYAPLSILTWDNVCFDDYKIKMIRLVESKFLYHVNVRPWVLDKLNRAWRKYKGQLKKIYDSFATVSDALKNTPENVNEENWRFLVSDWCSEKKKKQCEINRNNCKSKKTYHLHGRKSSARKSKELEDEKDWDSPDHGTSTEAAHRKKVLKSLSDIETRSVTSEDNCRDKKRKAVASSMEGTCPVVEATPKKAARMKISQVTKTPSSETITPTPIIRPEPAVPYKRRSRRLSSSTPSKQLPLSSEMQSQSSEFKSKGKVPVNEAFIVEEVEEEDGDGEDETITPAPIIPPEPAIPYKRRSHRVQRFPSKQLPLPSKMQSRPKFSGSKSKGKFPVEEALIEEEIEEEDDGGDDDYVESALEASKSFSDKEDGEDEEIEEEKEDVEEARAEMEGAPEETIAAIDLLVEQVTRPSVSAQTRELEENEESIAAPKKGNNKKRHEKKEKNFKEKEASQPEIVTSTDPEEQPISVILCPFEANFGGTSSSSPNHPTDNTNNPEEVLSHASQFEQILKKVQDDCLNLRNLYFTNMEKLKVKDNSFTILSLKYGALEEEAKVLREEKVLLKQKVKELEIQLKEAENSLPSEEIEEKLLQLQLELNDAKSREIEAKRALSGKELEIIQKDNEILRLKAHSRNNSRLANCTCNSTKSSASNPSEITKELVDQVMASDIFKSQQAIKEYEWMYYSMRCALIRAHFNLGIPSSEIWKIVTMHPNEAAIASETEGSILQYINHVLSLWVQLMNKGSGSPEEQADLVTRLQEVPFPFSDGKEAFQYQKKQGAQPDPWYDMYDRTFGTPSGLVPSLPSAAALVSAHSKGDELLWRFEG